MQHIQVWRAARMWLVGLVVFTAATALSGVLPGVGTPIAEASVAQDKKDDEKQKDRKERERDAAQQEDTTLNGQVIEINTLKDPPELIVGSVDGAVVVRVLKTDEIAMNGVKIGDYVELTGEKIHEQLFEATAISVDNSSN